MSGGSDCRTSYRRPATVRVARHHIARPSGCGLSLPRHGGGPHLLSSPARLFDGQRRAFPSSEDRRAASLSNPDRCRRRGGVPHGDAQRLAARLLRVRAASRENRCPSRLPGEHGTRQPPQPSIQRRARTAVPCTCPRRRFRPRKGSQLSNGLRGPANPVGLSLDALWIGGTSRGHRQPGRGNGRFLGQETRPRPKACRAPGSIPIRNRTGGSTTRFFASPATAWSARSMRGA